MFIQEDGVKIIDNIPIVEARRLFEEGVKSTTNPIIAELKRKAWEDKDYEPSEEELAAIKEWARNPEIFLNEAQLQKIYEFPAGSLWDFFLAVLGIKKIPTTIERIEMGFDSYVALYNFTPEQTEVLRRIKDVFAANVSSGGRVDVDGIFSNPIYSRLIGEFDEVNGRFEGRLREIIDEMEKQFKVAA